MYEGLAVSGCDLKPEWKVKWYPVDFSTVKFPVVLSLGAHTEDKEKWVPPAGTHAAFLGVLESPH